jgi:hypothetical protein
MSPFKSKAQNAWGHTPEGVHALKGKLDEWEASTDYRHLPEHVTKKKTKESIVKKLIKNKKKK